MDANGKGPQADRDVTEFTGRQLRLLTEADPRCRGLQLPEGIMLRYNLAGSLYFYLKTGVRNGKIATRIFASDSPYDREKAAIGEVETPMFEPEADLKHLEEARRMLHAWVEFVREDPESEREFQTFEFRDRRH